MLTLAWNRLGSLKWAQMVPNTRYCLIGQHWGPSLKNPVRSASLVGRTTETQKSKHDTTRGMVQTHSSLHLTNTQNRGGASCVSSRGARWFSFLTANWMEQRVQPCTDILYRLRSLSQSHTTHRRQIRLHTSRFTASVPSHSHFTLTLHTHTLHSHFALQVPQGLVCLLARTTGVHHS